MGAVRAGRNGETFGLASALQHPGGGASSLSPNGQLAAGGGFASGWHPPPFFSGVVMAKLGKLPPLVAALPPLVAPMAKVADTLYTSPEWRALMREIKAVRGNYCQDCGAGGRIIGDHVDEVKDGGAVLDPANVRLRCMTCHNRKTAAARRARAGM